MADTKSEDNRHSDEKAMANLYMHLIDNHKETFMYYLSENAVLDWFGRTLRGRKNIHSFIKRHIRDVLHHFNNARPVPKIEFRDTHMIREVPKINKVHKLTAEEVTEGNKTKTLSNPSSSHFIEQGQGDGLHNCDLPSTHVEKNTESVENVSIKYLTSEGTLEFRKKSNKKLQKFTKWFRPCKLAFAYSGTKLNDFMLHLIIYEGNSKCRKNLLKDFENAK